MRTPSSLNAPVRLVGRDRELAVLHDHLSAALAQRGSLVLIGGEAGIGKTALAETICREAVEQGALVLTGHCYDLTETPPYGPWVELFGQYEPADALPLPDAFAKPGTVGEVTSQAAIFQQVLAFTHTVAIDRPLLLLLDDLHWADPASLDLLRFLARALATLRVLLVVTYRADELTRRHPLYGLLPILVREAPATRIDLRPLRPDDLAALVHARYRLPDADAAQLVAYLNERSEGNPFFLGELLRTLEEEAVLRHTDDGWALGALAGVQVPPLLRQVIDGRLARLGDDAQALLAIAAVIGQEVPLDIWATVAGVSEETLLAAIEQAAEARLVVEAADGMRAAFAHALIREALNEGIVPSRRRVWHRTVAEALVALPQPDPDVVAHHFQQAGDDRAVEWLTRAGDRARRAYARRTAAERYEAALALMETRPQETSERGWLLVHLARLRRYSHTRECFIYLDEAARVATAIGDRALAAITLMGQGMLHLVAGEFERGFAAMAAGADACAALSASDQARINRHENYGNLSHLRGYLIRYLAITGRYRDALAMGGAFFAAFPTAEVERGAGDSSYANGWAGFAVAHAMLGHPSEALAASTRAIEVYRIVEHHSMVGGVLGEQLTKVWLPYFTDRVATQHTVVQDAEDAWVRSVGAVNDLPTGWASLPLAMLRGEWAAARAVGDALPETSESLFLLVIARTYFAPLAHAQGAPELAWAQINALVPDGPTTAPGNMVYDGCILQMQRLAVALALDAGDLALAHEWLEAHDRWLAWNGAVLGQSDGDLLWAQYFRAAGDPRSANDRARQALARAIAPRQPLALLAAHRFLGELDTNAGRFDEAATHLEQSLALTDACAAPYERALTLLALAKLRAAQRKPADASTLLDEIRAVCTALGAKPTLDRTDALATRLATMKDAPHTYPAGLSAREVEVLRLVADGLTNAQVAEHLFLSPHTINAHLTTIYAKLDVPSRAAAIRFALDHGLR